MDKVLLYEYDIYIPLHNSYNTFKKYIEKITHTKKFFIRKNKTIIQPHNYCILQKNDILHIEHTIKGGRMEEYPNFSSIISMFFHPIITLLIILPIYFIVKLIIQKENKEHNNYYYLVFGSFVFYASIFIAYLYVYFSKDMNILYILFAIPFFFPILFSILPNTNFITIAGFSLILFFSSFGLLTYIGFANSTFPIRYFLIGLYQVILAMFFVYILQKYQTCKSITKYVICIILINSLFSIPILLETFMNYV